MVTNIHLEQQVKQISGLLGQYFKEIWFCDTEFFKHKYFFDKKKMNQRLINPIQATIP